MAKTDLLNSTEVRKTLGLGYGMFATMPIPKGTRFVIDQPIMTLSPKAEKSINEFCREYDSLSPKAEKEFNSLHCDQAKELKLLTSGRMEFNEWYDLHIAQGQDINLRARHNAVNRYIRANATYYTNCANSYNGYTALYPYFSRANHSCDPNTTWEPKVSGCDMKASRDIAQGEQIFVSYIPLGKNRKRAERQAILSGWGFLCACTLCEAEKE
ncbi:hypothetical protein AAE478_004473 [Parahypoxylon ruwenzoriense]